MFPGCARWFVQRLRYFSWDGTLRSCMLSNTYAATFGKDTYIIDLLAHLSCTVRSKIIHCHSWWYDSQSHEQNTDTLVLQFQSILRHFVIASPTLQHSYRITIFACVALCCKFTPGLHQLALPNTGLHCFAVRIGSVEPWAEMQADSDAVGRKSCEGRRLSEDTSWEASNNV